METTKVFTSGNSQAVRLPKKYRLNSKEVFISQVGDAIVILPKKKGWDSLIASLDKFSDDFLIERKQPELDDRGDLF